MNFRNMATSQNELNLSVIDVLNKFFLLTRTLLTSQMNQLYTQRRLETQNANILIIKKFLMMTK